MCVSMDDAAVPDNDACNLLTHFWERPRAYCEESAKPMRRKLYFFSSEQQLVSVSFSEPEVLEFSSLPFAESQAHEPPLYLAK